MSFFKHKKYLFSTLLVLSSVIFAIKPAFSQIDYSYGLNKKGLRFSLGLGANTLQTTWTQTPVGYTVLGGLSYDMSNYFSIVVEGQYGSMSGADITNTRYYGKTVVLYTSISGNLRFALGLLSDFQSQNGFTDAIKRSYIGLGYGQIFDRVTLTDGNTTVVQGAKVATFDQTSNTHKSTKTNAFGVVPISIGTNIALPGVWGSDVVELNPNIQYGLFLDAGTDGYQPSPTSGNGGYMVISMNFRFKF
ncbi:hypothetical protein KXQ82_08135 [Mucilaginibacter sp. HMF5004]|uniref:hypothetical protein n=1 Tax=Mucilaginibacter rivuli TaxID=2857527 RepID=UPI001C5FE8BB|nr:hypothetical protein [Mucilaginibacter rivuli]MBW4889681.1 hypothetical protein [Mucilaginibacter rivuli]